MFFSGIATLIFIVVTGGRIPSYLGCSGSIVSAVISITGYKTGSGLNQHIAPVQGAILVLGLVYSCVATLIILFGHSWLEFIMPPSIYIYNLFMCVYINYMCIVVTGSIIASIGLSLSFMAFDQITTTTFDAYMALVTAIAIMVISIYAPLPGLRRL